MDWKIWHSGYGHFLIRDKKWVIIIFKWERIFSLVGSDFVCNSFYIESEVVANTSDNNTIKNQKVQLINVNSKMRKNLFYFLTKKGRTFPLVKISFFERY